MTVSQFVPLRAGAKDQPLNRFCLASESQATATPEMCLLSVREGAQMMPPDHFHGT